jgi:ABC-type transport system involved in cytochrome bd biosynthesis fused ATPase/permease subunit
MAESKPKKPKKTTKTLVVSPEAHAQLRQLAKQSHAMLHGKGAFADTYILNKLNEDSRPF